jgi:Flp pilus assembly pilin Flp
MHMRMFLDRLLLERHGAVAIEYGLIASLISMAIFVAVQSLGQNVLTDLFTKIAGSFTAT